MTEPEAILSDQHQATTSCAAEPCHDSNPYCLNPTGLKLAVGFAMLGTTGLGTEKAQQAAWSAYRRLCGAKTQPTDVAPVFWGLLHAGWGDGQATGPDHRDPYGSARRRMKRTDRLPQKRGVQLTEIADLAGVPRSVLACALEHHGFLHLAPYGGTQSHRLVTREAEAAGYEHNADPSSSRSPRLDGHHRSSVLPVFCEDQLQALLWVLNFEGIKERAAEFTEKKERLAWLLGHHHYLPSDFLAQLAGYSERGVRKARHIETAKVPPQVI